MLREELSRLTTVEERHHRLFARLLLAFLGSLFVFFVGAVLIWAFESGRKVSDIHGFGDPEYRTLADELLYAVRKIATSRAGTPTTLINSRGSEPFSRSAAPKESTADLPLPVAAVSQPATSPQATAATKTGWRHGPTRSPSLTLLVPRCSSTECTLNGTERDQASTEAGARACAPERSSFRAICTSRPATVGPYGGGVMSASENLALHSRVSAAEASTICRNQRICARGHRGHLPASDVMVGATRIAHHLRPSLLPTICPASMLPSCPRRFGA